MVDVVSCTLDVVDDTGEVVKTTLELLAVLPMPLEVVETTLELLAGPVLPLEVVE